MNIVKPLNMNSVQLHTVEQSELERYIGDVYGYDYKIQEGKPFFDDYGVFEVDLEDSATADYSWALTHDEVVDCLKDNGREHSLVDILVDMLKMGLIPSGNYSIVESD